MASLIKPRVSTTDKPTWMWLNRIFAAFSRAVNAVGDENFSDTAAIATAHMRHPLVMQSSSWGYYETTQFVGVSMAPPVWYSHEGCYLMGVSVALQDMDSQVGTLATDVWHIGVETHAGVAIADFYVGRGGLDPFGVVTVPYYDYLWTSGLAPVWYAAGVRIRVDTAGAAENKDAMLAVRIWTAKLVQT